jgi:hypothetical protein
MVPYCLPVIPTFPWLAEPETYRLKPWLCREMARPYPALCADCPLGEGGLYRPVRFAQAMMSCRRPAVRHRSVRHLSLMEREEISRGVAGGESLRVLARRLGRAPSTLSREVARNGGRHRYRAHRADGPAWQRARRPQDCKLASNHTLRAIVEELLTERWSPQQIAGWLARTYPGDEEMRVSHETIYLTLFIQARGGLKRELTQHLRTRWCQPAMIPAWR